MKTLIKLSAVLLLFMTTTSCFLEGVKGNRNVVTEQRKLTEEFSAIKASQGIDVYFTMGNNVSLSVEADENLQDIIITEVKGETLHIYADKNIWNAKAQKVYVTAPELSEIRVNSGARLVSENTIKAEDLNISATSGSGLKLLVNAANLDCSVTSGADIRLEGKAQSFEVSATSGSQLKAKELEAETCIAKATSGANIYINVTQDLKASATSGGDIKYIGNPKKLETNDSVSGNISSRQQG